jgi:hypothetical protein
MGSQRQRKSSSKTGSKPKANPANTKVDRVTKLGNSFLCNIGLHRWGKWKTTKIKKWISFSPQLKDRTKTKLYSSSLPGKYILVDKQETECLICGKIKREAIHE